MGSGASKTPEKKREGGRVREDDEVENFDDLYLDKKEEELVDVPVTSFPCLKNSRFWRSKNPTETPVYDEENERWIPTHHAPETEWVEELKDREVKVEIEDALLTAPIEALVEAITTKATTDMDKVLAFYRWLREVETNIPSANEDHAAYYFARQPKEPIAVLQLFEKMCQACKIDCEVIRGFAKGATFAKKLGDPTMRFREPNHHWIAVCIEKLWYLIDLSWCIQQNTDFYFLCEPAIFVYNHLPADDQKQWQLLYRPVRLEEFKELAFLHKAFYYHELELMSHQTCTIRAYTGEEVVVLRYNEERIWSYRLTCEKVGSVVTTVGGVPLERCVMVEAFEGKARFIVRFPSADRYRLDIFCQDPDFTATPPSLVVTYILQAHKAQASNFSMFPKLDTMLWGMTRKTLESGLTPKSHTRGRVLVVESAQITFGAKKEQYLICHLDTEQETDFDLEQCVIDSYNPDEKEVSVNILLPLTGLYKLDIYLEPEEGADENAEKVYVISYLLECTKPFSQKLVFQNYGDKLGVQSMKKVLLEAIRTKSLHKLRAAVALMKANKLKHKVAEEAALAEDMLAEMERIDEMKQAIQQTDRGTMSEMRNYSKPPQAVHDVLIAALLLLGDSEDKTKLWTDVQSKCGNIGKVSLSRRIRQFNILYVHHEIAARTAEILERHDINALQAISPGAALFYSWGLMVSMEVINRVTERKQIVPANLKRQKEIFAMIAQGTWPEVESVVLPDVTP